MTAYTTEIDETEDALAEIMGQLDLNSLKKNSVGIITCHFDFTDTGFLGELCEKLPFDVVGMTTMASANRHGMGMYALSLTVLTSDEVVFETAMTGPLKPGDYKGAIEAAYSETVKKLPGPPSLIITFFPFFKNLSGALIHRAFDEVCGGVPFWGSAAAGADASYGHSNVFRGGEVAEDRLVMILLHGPVNPEFIVVSIPTKNIRKDRGTITDSDGCLLKRVNGISALKYLENLGLTIIKDASVTAPLMVYYEGSSVPVAVGIYSVDDDGNLLCGGEMTKGASLAVGEITNEGIMATAGESMTRLLECGKRDGALLLPCVSRYVMLAPEHDIEQKLIIEKLENGNVMPFMAAYSGGEICPVRDEAGVLRNRFHNYTFSVCVL
jgi:hypothetical protein